MAKVYERMCLQNWFIEDQMGNRLDLFRGKEYTTSASREDGTVAVYSTFWVRAPISIFEPVTPEKP